MAEFRSNDENFIRSLTDIILDNLANPDFGVRDLSEKSGISHYSLSRRLHAINRKTINQFIREVRLRKALEMLINEDITASEAAYRTGFGSPVYFNKCFHEFFGYPPGKVNKGAYENIQSEVVDRTISENTLKRKKWNSIIFLPLVIIFISLAGIGAYNIFHRINTDKPDEGRVSIAVMPFRNLSNDTTLNIWQEGFQQDMIATLSDNPELKLRQRELVNILLKTEGVTMSSVISPVVALNVSRKLDAGIFIFGSIQTDGPRLRLDAQLIQTGSGEVMKTFEVNGSSSEKDYFVLIDTLRKKVTDFLLLSRLIRKNPLYGTIHISTSSPEALRCFLNGEKDFDNWKIDAAISWYLKALEADSNYFEPMLRLSSAYGMTGRLEDDLKWVIKYYNKRKQWPEEQQIAASWAYAFSFEPPGEAIKYLIQAEQSNDQDPSISNQIGNAYMAINQYDNAIPEFEKHLKICKKWGRDFLKDNITYFMLGRAYDKTRQIRKEKRLFREAAHYLSENWLTTWKALLSFTEGDTVTANKSIGKYIEAKKRNSASEADICSGVGDIYYQAGLFKKADNYYSRALELDSNNIWRIITLTNFYIDNNIHLEKVSALVDIALKQAGNRCDYYNYLDLKGWSLFKLGNYQDALHIIQDVWNNAPFRLYKYKLHLEEVKKALSTRS